MNHLPGYDQPPMTIEDWNAVHESLTTDASARLTICEQLRFIYDTVTQVEDPKLRQELKEQLIVAFQMGKKMNSRLAHYKREFLDESGRTGKSLLKLSKTKERKAERQSR